MLRRHQASFVRRRVLNMSLAMIAIGCISVVAYTLNQSLRHSAFVTGYVLLSSFVLLAALGMRKRLPFLPSIGSARGWTQVHIYVGLVTFAVFGWHIGWRIPNGVFESTLAILYLIVSVSGLYGLLITRTYPKKLTSVGGEVVYETIPWRRAQIAQRARTLVLNSADSTDVLSRFYLKYLADFLEKPRGWLYWLIPTGQKKRQLVTQIGELDRYLDQPQRSIGQQLAAYVEERDRLDYHHALQSKLKTWLFLHIGFTYSLLLFSVLHMVLAHAFWGGQ